jgi:hypothetical protein
VASIDVKNSFDSVVQSPLVDAACQLLRDDEYYVLRFQVCVVR